MPTIYDNKHEKLIDALAKSLPSAEGCSFCVGYLNLRGWDQLSGLVNNLSGGKEEQACRVLVGMHRPPEEEMKTFYRLREQNHLIDGPMKKRLTDRIAASFKDQIEFGVPSNEAEMALRRLAEQIRQRKVFLRAFLDYQLHAKLYIIRRQDPATPLIAYLGSSNLTLAGLSKQGELNVDIVDQDAAEKLQRWFDERWEEAVDLGDRLAEIIETSWVRRDLVRPYLVYLKIAYELSAEARIGERKFEVPTIFAQKETPLLDFQEKAVSLAAYHLEKRGGVLLGDVVGLGKTLMATAIARIFQQDYESNILVVCPPKLQPMWEYYLEKYEIIGRALSVGKVADVLDSKDAPRYRLVIIDESHNLCNREGKRYRILQDYIKQNESRVLLLTATPYNRQFTDLSNQLRLFLDEEKDLRIRPERFLQDYYSDGRTEADFRGQFQTSPYTLRAFEKSNHPDDWRELMRLFLVRRTRQFIIKHYAHFDEERQRYYVTLNGVRNYFPIRKPKRVDFEIREDDPDDQYAQLFHDDIVSEIGELRLPRYGMRDYLVSNADVLANEDQKKIIDNLTRAGRSLIGFCRVNLFKRLESSGHSFLISLDRHILRNLVALYAYEHNLPLPIGAQNAPMLDTSISDSDEEFADTSRGDGSDATEPSLNVTSKATAPSFDEYRDRAAKVYRTYSSQFPKRFDWIHPKFFRSEFREALLNDSKRLYRILRKAGMWKPEHDAKLIALEDLITKRHPDDKLLIFTQFADTAIYIGEQLRNRGISDCAVVTNQTNDPVACARRFSPATNGGLRKGESELRILIATDVLAEGQNLQDAHLVVNYDLPWAIIRLIQRAGRVDRIGQKHDEITVYSFMPAEGIERIIRLRTRLSARLQTNQDIIGTDETFFGEDAANTFRDLYTEKSGVLDDDVRDEEIDISSMALQVWNSASERDQEAARRLPQIVNATREVSDGGDPRSGATGAITYLQFPDNTHSLIRVDKSGEVVSQSITSVFRAAACRPETAALPRDENHFSLVKRCVEIAIKEDSESAGHLGTLRSARRKLWDRLKRYRTQLKERPDLPSAETLENLDKILNRIWAYPLKSSAEEAISRQMALQISDEGLFDLVLNRDKNGTLFDTSSDQKDRDLEPKIICSLGLVEPKKYEDLET